MIHSEYLVFLYCVKRAGIEKNIVQLVLYKESTV